MKVVQTRGDFAAVREDLDGPVGLVPTMGALHAGHAALLETAHSECASVITTNFVNPLQFGPSEDLAQYPRTLDADLELCEAVGVDVVWAPTVVDVYPPALDSDAAAGTDPAGVGVDPGPLGTVLDGEVRPGHFAGVLTVVAKFFNLVRPDRAYFGEKDYQQLTLIARMVRDLDMGVTVVGVPTVREPDGLALSSRNAYLSATERRHALALSRALFAGRAAAQRETGGRALAAITAATGELAAETEVRVDYLELRGADLGEIPDHGPARLLVAARVGTTRLIDNIEVIL